MRTRGITNLDRRYEVVKDRLIIVDKTITREELIGNYRHLYAEFGMGKGKFIREMAKRNQKDMYIGIDKYLDILVQASEKLETENVKILKMDLSSIREYMHENMFDGLFLNFSDPWPKNKHYKRRLTYRSFLDLYDFVVRDGAEIAFKTDNSKLFAFTLEELFATNRVAYDITLDLHNDSRYVENIKTEYEEKFEKQGPIYGLKWKAKNK